MRTFFAALFGALFTLVRPAGAATRVACVGDSITAGSGLLRGETYPEALGRLLGRGWLVANFGRGGATAVKSAGAGPSYWSTIQYTFSRRFEANVVVILLGTNDSKPLNWRGGASAFEADYRDLIATYQSLPRRPRVFLALPPPALSGRYDVDGRVIEADIIPAVRRLATLTGSTLVDVHGAFGAQAGGYFAREGQPEGDGVHPNAEGSRVIARTVASAILSSGCQAGSAGRPGGGVLLLLALLLTRLRL